MISEFGIILVSLASCVLLMWIARAILVDPHLRNQRAMISIMAKFSLQHGVSKDEIDNILNQLDDK